MAMSVQRKWFVGSGYDKVMMARSLLAYGAQQQEIDLDKIVDLLQSATQQAVGPSGLACCHFTIGEAYYVSYHKTGSLDDLTWALRRMRQAVEEDDPTQDRAYRLRLLSEGLLTAVEQLNEGEDPAVAHLNLIDAWLEEALSLCEGEAKAMCLNLQGLAFYERARHVGSYDALVDALKKFDECKATSENSETQAGCWGNIGKAFTLAYKSSPSPDLAMRVVLAYDTAAMTSKPGDPSYKIHLAQQQMIRQTFGLPQADPSPWMAVGGGFEVNYVTGEVKGPDET